MLQYFQPTSSISLFRMQTYICAIILSCDFALYVLELFQLAIAGIQQDVINTGTMQYTGQAGRFLYSVDDGPNSDYLQCVYRPEVLGQPNIIEL